MTDDTQTFEPTTASAPGRLRDRVLGLRAVAAVALAALILGGAGGAALGAISNGADSVTGPGGRGGPGGTFQQGQLPGGQQGGPGLAPPAGGLPPATAPRDDVQPDAEGDGDTGSTGAGQNT